MMGKQIVKHLAAALMLWWSVTAAWAGDVDKAYLSIESWDGTELAAVVMVPSGQGAGPFPLLVMPASWALGSLEYVGRGTELAADGYVVVSFTTRGFWESGGEIDIAGDATVADVSAVIDWALDNTPSDPDAIGVSGISYGAGLSLLAAERDPRIRAVAALSGWADLEASLYANQTTSSQAVGLLVASAYATGNPGPELSEIAALVAAGDHDGAVQGFLPYVPSRNPATAVTALNASAPAVLLANAFNDGLFPPNEYVDFYNQLQGPRHLMLSQGDHATAELPGALGFPNEVYEKVERWFDHYLKGSANGIDAEPPVELQKVGGDWLEYASWDAVQSGSTTLYLGAPDLLTLTGGMSSSLPSAWGYTILSDLWTVADSGTVLASGFLQQLGLPLAASIPLVNRYAAGVWFSAPLNHNSYLAGSSHLQLTVTPSQSSVSLYCYLYAMDALGNGTLISHKPYSLRSAIPWSAQTINLDLEAAATDIPSGYRLVLVVDTLDDRYTSVTQPGGLVTFSSSPAAPVTLQVPVH